MLAIVPLSALLYVSSRLHSTYTKPSIILEQVEIPITWISVLTSPSWLSRMLPFCDTSHHFSDRERYRSCRTLKWLIFVHRIVASLLKNLPSSIERGMKHLQPLIEERRRQRAEYGDDYPDKPVSFLSISIAIPPLQLSD